jgi:hypothetical protein
VISESRYWKQPLVTYASRLAKLARARCLSERKLAHAERDLFFGFYAVRKLLDSPGKISDKVAAMQVELTCYPNSGERVTWRNVHRVESLYRLEDESQEIRDIRFVCGRIIHSYAFAVVSNEGGGFGGALFGSDRDRQSLIYFLSANRIIQLFKDFGTDYPDNIAWRLDPATGKETVSAW